MGDNGKVQEQKSPPIEMKIIVEDGKPMQVFFPLLGNEMVTYGFLKLAEKTLDVHYLQSKSKIIKSGGSVMDFVRNKK